MITKIDIFNMLFSGIGAGMGLNLYKEYSNFLALKKKRNKEEKEIGFLDFEVPEMYKDAIMSITEGIFKKKKGDFSFIPSGREAKNFIERWNHTYPSTLQKYRRKTDNMFKELIGFSDFRQVTVVNELEYKRIIEKVVMSYEYLYCGTINQGDIKRSMDDFKARLEKFHDNLHLQKSYENEINIRDISFRNSRYPSCSVDILSRRVKTIESMADKATIKLIGLIDKIYFTNKREKKKEDKVVKITYDNLVITDVLGFLIVQAVEQEFNDSIIKMGKLETIRDSSSDPKIIYPQRQFKLIHPDGILYDCHLFNTLGDLMDNEFTKDDTGTGNEVLPHMLYKYKKNREVLEKNKAYKGIYDILYNEILALLKQCFAEPITPEPAKIYMSSGQRKRKTFLEQKIKEFETDLDSYDASGKESKRQKVGLKTLEYKLNNILQCCNVEIDEKFDYDVEDLHRRFVDVIPREKAVIDNIDYVTIDLVKRFNDMTKTKYSTQYPMEIATKYRDLIGIYELNTCIEEKYQGLKKHQNTSKLRSEHISLIDFYIGKLTKLNDTYPSGRKITIQTEFNIYKHLINSYKIPNHTIESGGSKIVKSDDLDRYIKEFNTFVNKNKAKLSTKQISEINDIDNPLKY